MSTPLDAPEPEPEPTPEPEVDPDDPGSRPGLGFSVLVVEDSPDVGAIVVDALDDEGCTTFLARNGAQALDLARRCRPDLITLDLGLPEVSGSDVILALRADPATRDIPIVAVSAHSHELPPYLARQVARTVGKPFYLSDVVSAVLDTLGRRAS